MPCCPPSTPCLSTHPLTSEVELLQGAVALQRLPHSLPAFWPETIACTTHTSHTQHKDSSQQSSPNTSLPPQSRSDSGTPTCDQTPGSPFYCALVVAGGGAGGLAKWDNSTQGALQQNAPFPFITPDPPSPTHVTPQPNALHSMPKSRVAFPLLHAWKRTRLHSSHRH